MKTGLDPLRKRLAHIGVVGFLLALLGAPSAMAALNTTPDPSLSTDAAVYSLARSGSTLFLGGDFGRVGAPTGANADIDATTDQANTAFVGANGVVNAVVSDNAGGYYIAGTFTSVAGVARSNIAHILPSGAADPAFAASTNSAVYSLLLSNGVLYLGGDFGTVDGTSHLRLAAVDATSGALLTGFTATAGNTVFALALSGSKLYVGGRFGTIGGQTESRLAALDPTTGAVDTGFSPNADSTVFTILPSGANLYVGGAFLNIGGAARSRLASVDATTGVATSFAAGAIDSTVRALALSDTGATLYVGGSFSTIGTTARKALAAVDTGTGAVDPTFKPDPNATGGQQVLALSVTGNTLYVGGTFTAIGGAARNNLAAVDTSGVATAFNPNANNYVAAIAVSGTHVDVGGNFNFVGAGTPRAHLAAIDTNTGQLTTFDPGVDGDVYSLRVVGGTLYVGGTFATVGGLPRSNIAAIDIATGAVIGFAPQLDGGVFGLGASTDGSTIYAGGGFDTFDGQPRSGLAAFSTATGAVTPFTADVDDAVDAAPIFSGGNLFVAGEFTTLSGQPRTLSGAVDTATGAATAFNPNVSGASNFVEDQKLNGNTLYLAGSFATAGGATRANLAAVDTTTNIATSFAANLNSFGYALTSSPSSLLVGGNMTTVKTLPRTYLAEVDPSTGAPSAFNPFLNGPVYTLLYNGGKLYVGGFFGLAGSSSASYKSQNGFAVFTDPSAATSVRWRGGRARFARGRGVSVRWATGAATDILGFDVLRARRSGRGRVKLTRRLIPGPATSAKRRFRFLDRAGRVGDLYYVVAVGLDGKRKVHGPLAAPVRPARTPRSAAVEAPGPASPRGDRRGSAGVGVGVGAITQPIR